jgi:glyceraldehyde 3-phosphate dehydrogenase
MYRIGINGFGRIGRAIVRAQQQDPRFAACTIVAVNDPAPHDVLVHLLRYDSTYGRFGHAVCTTADGMQLDGRAVRFTRAATPDQIPWHGVDYVIDVAGKFLDATQLAGHMRTPGVRRVILGAPARDASMRTLVLGVNEATYQPETDRIVSNASCTTNALAPLLLPLIHTVGIRQGLITTVHAYTNDQRLLDSPHSDWRRARGASQSIIPTKTGAAAAIGRVLPELDGKLDGISVRVPTPNVSLLDVVLTTEQPVTADAVNQLLAAQRSRYLDYTDEPLVSHDFLGNPHSATVDSRATRAIGTSVQLLAWYDNEWGYANRLLDLILYLADRDAAP